MKTAAFASLISAAALALAPLAANAGAVRAGAPVDASEGASGTLLAVFAAIAAIAAAGSVVVMSGGETPTSA